MSFEGNPTGFGCRVRAPCLFPVTLLILYLARRGSGQMRRPEGGGRLHVSLWSGVISSPLSLLSLLSSHSSLSYSFSIPVSLSLSFFSRFLFSFFRLSLSRFWLLWRCAFSLSSSEVRLVSFSFQPNNAAWRDAGVEEMLLCVRCYYRDTLYTRVLSLLLLTLPLSLSFSLSLLFSLFLFLSSSSSHLSLFLSFLSLWQLYTL